MAYVGRRDLFVSTSNAYLLALARCCESTAMAERGHINYPNNRLEVIASVLQALLQTLGGGEPSFTAMPNDVPMVATDPAQVATTNPEFLAWLPFVPAFPFGTLQVGSKTGVPADGSSAVTIAYPAGFAFATATTQVFPSINNNYQANPWGLTIQQTAYTPTGFTVSVAGGPPSSTVTVDYLAIGS